MKRFFKGWGRLRLRNRLSWIEDAKKRAASEAVKHIEEGFTVGLGTGNTAAYAIKEIGRKIQQKKLKGQCLKKPHGRFVPLDAFRNSIYPATQ